MEKELEKLGEKLGKEFDEASSKGETDKNFMNFRQEREVSVY